MKISTEQQLKEHDAATRRGVIEGTLVSGAAAIGATYYMHRNFPTYRQLPLSLKALGVVIIVAPCLSIQAERRGLEYERTQWEGEGMRILDEKQMQVESRWSQMSTKDKLGDWAERHQYSIILGGWASSLAIAGAIISRDKYQSTPQKVVQARMWAQGLTIGILIAAGALSHSRREEASKHLNTDHSWRDLLEQQERDRLEAQRIKEESTISVPRRSALTTAAST